MIEEEIHAFLEVLGAFHSLESLVNSNMQTQKELRKELDEVVNSPKMVYGVIKITTKESKVAKLNDKLTKCDNDCLVSGELFSIISSYILETEIPNFKVNHCQKWNFLLNRFSEDRLKKLKTEQKFWEELSKATKSEEFNKN